MKWLDQIAGFGLSKLPVLLALLIQSLEFLSRSLSGYVAHGSWVLPAATSLGWFVIFVSMIFARVEWR